MKGSPNPPDWEPPSFEGPYNSWDQARNASDGWDAPAVLEKTLKASLLLRDGKIEFQQDTIIFSKIVYSSLFLATIAVSLKECNERLVLFDVGGSLGANFFQNRKILDAIGKASVSWNVIEMPATAELGRRHFETDTLRFFDSFEGARCAVIDTPQAVVFSGSLQYFPDPFVFIDKAIETGARYIALDRLLTSPTSNHAVYIQQQSPKFYYAATYPVWCFSLSSFQLEMRQRGLRLIEHFTKDPNAIFDHCGMLFRCNE